MPISLWCVEWNCKKYRGGIFGATNKCEGGVIIQLTRLCVQSPKTPSWLSVKSEFVPTNVQNTKYVYRCSFKDKSYETVIAKRSYPHWGHNEMPHALWLCECVIDHSHVQNISTWYSMLLIDMAACLCGILQTTPSTLDNTPT